MTGAKKPKNDPLPPPPPTHKPKANKTGDFRDALSLYIEHPETNPEGRIVEYDDEFVVINDKFPKSSYASHSRPTNPQRASDLTFPRVHLLLLPRDPKIYYQHPLQYLSANPAFLAKVRTRVQRLKALAASELRRQYGAQSASDAPYQTALETLMSSDDPPPPEARDALLPPGRDWSREIVAGVHTHPSMNHMHIHVLSREHNSPRLISKKHYLSFNTSFLVTMEDFPLEEGSLRFRPGNWPNWDLKCWRCGMNFQNKMAALVRHLEGEIEEWKKE